MKKIFDLEKELQVLLEKATENFELNTIEGEIRAPKIFIGPMPSEEPEDLVPAVGIRTFSGKNTLESKEICINVRIALLNEETEETHKIMYDLIDIITREIISKGIYLDEFEILPNMEWETEDFKTFMLGDISFKFIRNNIYRTDADKWIYGE